MYSRETVKNTTSRSLPQVAYLYIKLFDLAIWSYESAFYEFISFDLGWSPALFKEAVTASELEEMGFVNVTHPDYI